MDARDPSVVHLVRGGAFAWLDAKTLLVTRGRAVAAYRLDTRAATPFLEDAVRVRVVGR